MATNGIPQNTKFRQIFNDLKHIDCKNIDSLPESVVTFDSGDERVIPLPMKITSNNQRISIDDLTDPVSWQPVTIRGLEDGVIVIRSILTESASKKWFHRLLHEWPVTQADVLKSHVTLPLAHQDKRNLRWMTFGYHHDWTTKVYDMKKYDKVPEDLYSLFLNICSILDLPMKRPEAGIINYYHCKYRLSPHRDLSEHNYDPPLVSLSLGSPGIFMVGSQVSEDVEPIVPMLLRDGDLVIMAASRRLAYHAVPKVFCVDKTCADDQDKRDFKCTAKETTRININVRQVL
jgi:alkylated DNA repair protein alkB family protein 1